MCLQLLKFVLVLLTDPLIPLCFGDSFSAFIQLPPGFSAHTYARKEDFKSQNNMRQPRTIRSITYIHPSTQQLYVITYVAPKEVSPANDRVVTALIDIGGNGHVNHFQPVLSTWHDPSEVMYSELAPTSIAIDYSGRNENVYFTTYISTMVCRNVHRQVVEMNNDADRLDMEQCAIYFNWRSVTGEYYQFDNGDHGRHYAAINRKTNELCIAMGVDCDVCESCSRSQDIECEFPLPQTQILCCPTDDNGSSLRSITECTVKANGMRNSVGFDFHPKARTVLTQVTFYFAWLENGHWSPKDNRLWFTDNQQGRDNCDDKLNRVTVDGQHFGFPFCETFGFGDDDENGQRQIRTSYRWTEGRYQSTNNRFMDCSDSSLFIPPALAMGSHGVPMGMRFYDTSYIAPFSPYIFPEEYHNSIFIASRGRGSLQFTGYPLPRVLNVRLGGNENNENSNYNEVTGYNVFADGWQEPLTTNRIGRPQDVEVMTDGSLLISDEMRGAIYRITYDRNQIMLNQNTTSSVSSSLSESLQSQSPCSGLVDNQWYPMNDPLPVPLGEVTAVMIQNVLYVVGQGVSGSSQRNSDTFAYPLDSTSSTSSTGWSTVSPRIYRGNHHSSIVVQDEWWLIGGIDDNSPGTVQVYSPLHNVWREKASLPWPVGSACVAMIGHWIFVCGGIVENRPNRDYTQRECAYFDIYDEPKGWNTTMSPMPMGRNHAATASDGKRMYIFGGRTGGNSPSDGFDDVQIYDPIGDLWKTDKLNPDEVASLPVARGGMGTAVYFEGRFYIFGGETSRDLVNTGPNRTYDRVDIYDPISNEWTEGERMATSRHGIYPVVDRDAIYLPGGGTKNANSQSMVFDKYCPPKQTVDVALPVEYCCLAQRAPNWNGRCWRNTNEIDCVNEPRAGKRCYWDPENCLVEEPTCFFYDATCSIDGECCSAYCRQDIGQCR